MARPQSPDYDNRRAAIVAAAAGLYARRGFQGASIADLAKACGTSKSLVYHYFPAKEDILHAVMASHLDELVAAAESVVAAPGAGASDRLHALAAAFMRLYVGAADRHTVLLNELPNLPPAARSDVVAKQRRIIALVEALIRQIRPDADAPTFPLAMLFFGMINWTHSWFRADGPVSSERLAALAAQIMLGGLDGLESAQAS